MFRKAMAELRRPMSSALSALLFSMVAVSCVCDAPDDNITACDIRALDATIVHLIPPSGPALRGRGRMSFGDSVPGNALQCIVELPTPQSPNAVKFFGEDGNRIATMNVTWNQTRCIGHRQWTWGPTAGQACQPTCRVLQARELQFYARLSTRLYPCPSLCTRSRIRLCTPAAIYPQN